MSVIPITIHDISKNFNIQIKSIISTFVAYHFVIHENTFVL